jgi:hypothetical protein
MASGFSDSHMAMRFLTPVIVRFFLVAVFAAATPVAAQKPSYAVADTIRRAAIADTAERIAGYRISGDTAWTTIVDPRTLGLGAAREVRLVRRAAVWTCVSSRPVVIPPPLDTAPAKTFKLAPPPPRP